MIDVHCHILPDIDDGSDSMQTSLLMAAMAADDGVDCIIATPHITWSNDYDSAFLGVIKKKIRKLQDTLKEVGIPVTLCCGSEVLCTMEAAETFPRIQGTDYSLVEFYFEESAENINRYLQSMKDIGLRPIIAHPERYTAVQKNKELLRQWRNLGYYLQVNKGSLYGQFGRKAKGVAGWLLKHRMASLIASDAHNTSSRTTRMAAVRADVERRYGLDYAKLLTEENAGHLLRNEELRDIKK